MDTKLAIEKNEDTAATDTSVKDGIMEGVWKIEEDFEHVSMCGRSWSRNWNKSTCLVAKSAKLLDLVKSVDVSMKGHDEGQIKIHIGYGKAWDH